MSYNFTLFNQGSQNCIWVFGPSGKKMSVLINFLLQNTNLESVLSKFCPNFAGHV